MEIPRLVADRVTVHGMSTKSMILPYCTWDKYGDLFADGGERLLWLFHDCMSFVTTMNMYSSTKCKCWTCGSIRTSCNCLQANQKQERQVSITSYVYSKRERRDYFNPSILKSTWFQNSRNLTVILQSHKVILDALSFNMASALLLMQFSAWTRIGKKQTHHWFSDHFIC